MVGYRFFFLWTLSFSTICVKFLRISDTSCYLRSAYVIPPSAEILHAAPFYTCSKHHHSTQSIQCRLSFMFCGAQNFDFPQSPKRPSYCVGVLCWQQHQKQQPAWTTTYLLHCILSPDQCYRDPGLNDWTESTYYIPSKSTQACHPPMISWMLPDRTGGVQQRFDFPHSWTKHSRSPTILTRAKPTNSKQDDLTIFPRPSELDSTLRWQAPMPHRDRSLMPAYALRPKAQS